MTSNPPNLPLPARGISAHRGANATHPENTLAAFREAIRLGAHQIEFDVRLTKDGGLVIIHDATVDRTTNGHGAIAGMTLRQVQRLDAGGWKGAPFAGTPVPTLTETLAVMPRHVWLNVHLYGGPELGMAVTTEIVRQGRLPQSFLHCVPEAAVAARAVAPGVLICNIEHQNAGPRYVARTLERRCQFIQYFVEWPVEIAQVKAAGVRVNYCGTNDPVKLAQLFELGVDFVLVDDVAGMLHAAQTLGIEPLKPVDPP